MRRTFCESFGKKYNHHGSCRMEEYHLITIDGKWVEVFPRILRDRPNITVHI